MASALQELRKAAGYRTAKEFAAAVEIPLTTYARYESSPEKIPLPVAWRFADMFGVPIDLIVGRSEQPEGPIRGEVQARYDALAPEYRAMLDSYLEFLTQKNADEARRAARREERRIAAVCARLEDVFLAELDCKRPDFYLGATASDLREAFRNYLAERADERQEPEVRNSIDAIMDAYDRAHQELDLGGFRVFARTVNGSALREPLDAGKGVYVEYDGSKGVAPEKK